MPMILTSILAIPPDLPYHLCGEDAYTETVAKFLHVFRRDRRFAGLLRPADLDARLAEHYLVVTGSAWPYLLQLLRAKGIDEARQILLLNPVGDEWGCFDFMGGLLDAIRVAEDGWTFDLPLARLHERLTRMQSILVVDPVQGIQMDRAAYYPYFEEELISARDKIAQVIAGLANEKSRSLYRDLLRWGHVEMVQYYLAKVFAQYQYSDHITLKPGDVILNGGIESGFELPYFAAKVGEGGQIHCVDPLGFQCLDEFVKPTVAYYRNTIFIHPIALMDYSGEVQLGISSNQAKDVAADALVEARLTTPCVTIDGLVAQLGLTRLDLVKLDLEGAEERVLAGLLKLCFQFRPQVAIAIYHDPKHYWGIPLYFMERLRGYSYYIEHYSPGRYETLLYMIPAGREG